MPDWSVTTAIGAKNGLSGPFAAMSRNVVGFGSAAAGAFAHAERRASAFTTFLKAQVFGTLISGAIRGIMREIRQLPQMLTEFTTRADAISKQSRSIGLTAESFQRLQYAAGLANVSGDLLQGSFEKLNNQMGQMQAGTGTLVSVVGKLNPALARQLRTVTSSEEAFLIVSEAISQTANVSTRAAIAQAAFGRAGQDMLPMLLDGRTGIQKLMAEASKFGNLLTNETVVAAELFNDTLTRFNVGMRSVKETILTSIMTAIQPYIGRLSEWMAANKEIIAQKIEDVIQGIVRAGRWLVETFRPLVEKSQEWFQANKAVIGQKIEDVVRGLTRAFLALEPAIAWVVDHAGLVLGIAAAWKAVTFALGIARAAQLAMNLAAAAGGAAAAAGAVAPAVVGGLGPVASAIMGGGAAVAGGAGMAALTAIPVIGAAAAILPTVIKGVRDPMGAIESAKAREATGIIGKAVQWGIRTGLRLGGESAEPAAPNAIAAANQRQAAEGIRLLNENRLQFTVDNTAAPGVRTQIRPAPSITGMAGLQYVGAR